MSRKRPAPGASPSMQQPPDMTNNVFPMNVAPGTSEHFPYDWNNTNMDGTMGIFDDPLYTDYGLGAVGGQPVHSRVVSLDGLNDITAPVNDAVSGQLVRRNPNQQLAARRPQRWEMNNIEAQQSDWPNRESEEEELEQKALLAKKEAQGKRKSIPPFVQKLSSFLDDNKNTNLIRWSDDGNSFIVLDEDEFARTLIPELFKHNNYASFVRQLNMYGFHKKVGLSDNSMKASEMKAKAPSEYYNKYFRRGRPELLWLIQKPKNTTAGPKRKRDEDAKHGDSDDERKFRDSSTGQYGEDLSMRPNTDMAMIPRAEYNSLRNEVRHLQQQQKLISNVLGQIRQQNNQLYQQASTFQDMHNRHENSINAILTFLATFYNRSLEGNANGNLADLFHPNMNNQPRGNVVDVDEFPEKTFEKSPRPRFNAKRSLLLPAPAPKDLLARGGRAATLSPSVMSAAGSPPTKSRPLYKSPAMSRSTSSSAVMGTQSANPGASKEATPPTPQVVQNLPETDEIMSAIRNVNASASQSGAPSSTFDFSAALANYTTQGGNAPLTAQQRNHVLSLMANDTSAAAPNSILAHNNNNALVNPQPPPMPDLNHYMATESQLDYLQKVSEEQNARVRELQAKLQPLSPSGSIPGLEEGSYFGNAGNVGEPGHFDLDMDNFVNGDDFFPNNSNANPHNGNTGADSGDPATTLPDLTLDGMPVGEEGMTPDLESLAQFNQNNDAGNDSSFLGIDAGNEESRVESLSSSATSPAVTVEDADDEDVPSASKKRKVFRE
ncbi:hypothetical protein M011DRAFT_396885 [Sporormia fimetaria CBS 119925]|uniref:HSF-type DNA-binding domain-containing protein n=1 Tax=Sporormia fimetaria CBS 119925 TaxID=1340428 RepID=A0A6A6VKL2_9PLEO|nr:hypothetical protein M011DRAFT_396885 [Sporormia fimetaria CBS 119925]